MIPPSDIAFPVEQSYPSYRFFVFSGYAANLVSGISAIEQSKVQDLVRKRKAVHLG